ncbi:hypothetical protein ACQJBY_067038 [Aegilops geniculata]
MAASQSSPTTTSTCAAETAHGTHLFRITGYSLYSGIGVGERIKSATFAVGGYEWRLSYYPDGNNEEYKDWVSVFLDLKAEDAEVRAFFDLRLVDQAAQQAPPPFTLPDPSEITLFDSDAPSWGYRQLRKKRKLKKFILDDVLLIECSLTVINFKEALVAETMMKYEDQVPRSDLLDNLCNLLETQEVADVSFNVHGEVFRAHKVILAMRSPVFKAELYGPMSNECKRSITIEDMQPTVFKALLHFIYTDSLPPMDDPNDEEYEEMVKHLLVAADRYAMERMKLMCESKLCDTLLAENVTTRLALADQHHCSMLKDACIEFISYSNRMADVVASKGYERLKRTCPTICADILEKAAKARKI